MKNRVFLQVDEVGMSPVLLAFVAHGGKESAFIVATRTKDDNWDCRHESFHLVNNPNIKRHLIVRKRSNTHVNRAITGV